LPRRLIVEGNVSPHYRYVERPAGAGDPVDRFGELPEDLGPLGRAEVQAVRRRTRPRARARHVARGLAERHRAAAARVEIDLAAVAVGLDGHRPARTLDPQDSGVGARQHERVDADLVIVLTKRP